jgi:recombination associated protein RdgC
VFKNVTIYRMAPGWDVTLEAMETALATARFEPCGPTQTLSVGWLEPRGEAHGPLVESVAGQRILKLMLETRSVPSTVVREKADEVAAQIEATTGRKPGKKERRTLQDDARLALLPQAFPRRGACWVWLDMARGWLVTDAASSSKLDALSTALVNAFPSLSLQLLQTQVTPQSAMTQWLAATSPDEWPAGLSVERECELKSGDEEKSVVRFTRHNLATDEVRQHISEGKLPTRLALSFDGRIGFVLTESLQLKKLAFLEGVFDDRPSAEESGFDTDVALVTGELSLLLPALIEALGGEQVPGAAPPPAATAPTSAPVVAASTRAVAHDDPPF